MSEKGKVNELAERRQLLVMEADLHRSLIGLECEKLRERLAELEATRKRVAVGGPLLIAGGAAAGLLAARHWGKFAKWIPAALTGLRWIQRLRKSE